VVVERCVDRRCENFDLRVRGFDVPEAFRRSKQTDQFDLAGAHLA
jgi:hypothetical protein